jgi:hypothetical protein
MKCTGQTTLVMDVFGNTGYANNSRLALKIDGAGWLHLPDDKWDLSSIDLANVKAIELSIPSGMLKIDNVSLSIDKDELRFSGEGHWDGKQAGLGGGMSGYAGFLMQNPVVTDGVYHKWWASCPQPTLEEYNIRMSRSRRLWDERKHGKNIRAVEEEIGTDTTYRQNEFWAEWLLWLQSPEAIELEAEKLAQAEVAMLAKQEERRRQHEIDKKLEEELNEGFDEYEGEEQCDDIPF